MLAWIRAVDSAPAVVDTVRRARRALPGDPSFGDPLSTAGPGGVRAMARAADRLLDDGPGASREVSLGALQVWQALLERTGRGRGTREVTIVFTDLIGFSDWALAAGDEATLDLLRDVARAIEPPVADLGGHVVKRMGDGMMAVFTRPDRAIEAAFAARTALAEVRNGGYRPRMRVGIHTGVPRQIGADWLGVDVNVAARVMQAGGDANVMASSVTLDALEPGLLDDLGVRAKAYRRGLFAAPLRGVPDDLRLFTLTH
ncbi:adenylate/guanylate cyclase domain-containing protein [Rhodococcus spelaei]|uniref:Adenylate/guanylate cyclase domain-containing protein n=1 Tax=Rhodococcus spelaei TaxID=2546320 RepID=A0A541BB08_9NOCA|nr:adenylate/guanylate cyclase domain-containing protein [Rhodococcus spelaei]TQF69499.1 adenylate/guanylate cyclase domain-containing protein [Rhodococcus spelaei]